MNVAFTVCYSKIIPHVTNTSIKLINTAADPISLAFPISSCISVLTWSDSFSTAVLSSSVISTTNSEKSNNTLSLFVTSSMNTMGSNTAIATTSCLTAASLENAAFIPL